MAICSHCQQHYQKANSTHLRECTKYLFDVHEHPLSKTGPITQIRRNLQDQILCKCIDIDGNICTRLFKNQRTLFEHLKTTKHDSWLVWKLTLLSYYY